MSKKLITLIIDYTCNLYFIVVYLYVSCYKQQPFMFGGI